MNLFKGLEKFGLKTEGTENLFEEEKRTNASTEQGEAKEEIPSEESFLLEKSVRCTVCDKVFKTKMIKNGRVKRLEPDFDLRPRFMYIDTLKYDVASCPNCGYTAMNRYFEHLSSVQIKLIKEKICANFKPTGEEPAVYDYDTAINRYKLALFNTLVKKGKVSEKDFDIDGFLNVLEIHHILALHKLLIRNKPCQPNCRRYIPAMIGRQ